MDRTSLASGALPRRLLFGSSVLVLSLVLAACAQAGASGSGSASASASASASESASASGYASASGSASASESEAAGEAYEITVSDTSAGAALAGEGGMTLYTFDPDTAGVSTCTGGCADNWPPFTLGSGEEATAGEGVTGTIGTITRDDGSTQVTYNGKPLYYYAADQNPGDATGDGAGGKWHIATPTGGAASSGGRDY
jgi:predicted lipoprotein with Yx(FWY)xxD motif